MWAHLNDQVGLFPFQSPSFVISGSLQESRRSPRWDRVSTAVR